MGVMLRATRLALLICILLPLHAEAWIRLPAVTFATLPAGQANPEGITADAAGNIYVTTFAVTGTPPGQLFVFRRNGRLLRQVQVANASNLLLGLAFQPAGDLLVVDFGGQQVLTVDPVSGTSTSFTTIPDVADPVPPEAGPGPNALTFDREGNVYISDSSQGIIWRTNATGGALIPWAADALLKTGGVPPFGANGLAFNNEETVLFVANTGDDTVVMIPKDGSGNAEMPKVFVHSVNGADGLIIDDEDNLWIAANQADEIVVLDPTGRVIAKLGDFGGITPQGAPVGLLFPASLVRHGNFIYVTNLSLDLTLFNIAPPIDAPWAAQVTTHTVARIRARIPPVRGLP